MGDFKAFKVPDGKKDTIVNFIIPDDRKYYFSNLSLKEIKEPLVRISFSIRRSMQI